MNAQPKQRGFRIVGTRPVRPDGVEKVTGKAIYGPDQVAPGMLYGAVLRSPHAHARIRGIDARKAEALAGVLAAPIYSVNPNMGAHLIIVVFAVVVLGGMGSILGSILTGLALGLIEGLTKVFYPEASSIVVFVIMAIVLMIRPAGLFGKEK